MVEQLNKYECDETLCFLFFSSIHHKLESQQLQPEPLRKQSVNNCNNNKNSNNNSNKKQGQGQQQLLQHQLKQQQPTTTTALAAAMLLELVPEQLSPIFSFLRLRDLKNLSRCSKRFNIVVAPWLWKAVKFSSSALTGLLIPANPVTRLFAAGCFIYQYNKTFS